MNVIKPIPTQLLYVGYIFLVSGLIGLIPSLISVTNGYFKGSIIPFLLFAHLLFDVMLVWVYIRIFHGLITLNRKFYKIAIFLFYLGVWCGVFVLMQCILNSFTMYRVRQMIEMWIMIGLLIPFMASYIWSLHVLNREEIRELFELQSTEMAQEL